MKVPGFPGPVYGFGKLVDIFIFGHCFCFRRKVKKFKKAGQPNND
jgi:hypothetical protein